MTIQIKESILIDGEEYKMVTEPLLPYLKELTNKTIFQCETSACWRGYLGTWELKNNKLYLIELTGNVGDADFRFRSSVGLDYLFPNKKEVHADWFTGVISIPDGEIPGSGYPNFLPSYANNLLLHFDKGSLQDFKWVDTLEKMVDEVQVNQPNGILIFLQRLRKWKAQK
ncbi:MAG: hypothetical protein ACKVJF_03020 [Flavobacteriales bacterium]